MSSKPPLACPAHAASPEAALSAMRTDYGKGALDESDVSRDAVAQFDRWFADAEAAGVAEANAFTLATATAGGVPSARVVLLKGFDARGFVFYTNFDSRKGRELAQNPNAAAVFFWQAMERQVRVEGVVERVDRDEAKQYFDSRPVGSRVGAWASRQSEIVAGRAVIEEREKGLAARFGDDVPLPDFWGGFRIVPATVEFWQGRPSRLHDRLRYTKSAAGTGWTVDRLSP